MNAEVSKFLDQIERNAQRMQTIKDAKTNVELGMSSDLVIKFLARRLNLDEAESVEVFNNEVLENMSKHKKYIIELEYDNAANVWTAICNKIGLALEADSLDYLMEKLKDAVPEMIEINS